MRQYYPILSIAGSDSCGGAGIQADIKTISAIGGYAMTAITAITAQNTTGVTAIQGVDPEVVEAQIEMVWTDIPPLAVKTGMLYSREIVERVAACLERHHDVPVVVDPVVMATSGARLMTEDAIEVIKKRLFPLATLITPNVAEACALTGVDNPQEQAQAFRAMGCSNVLLKGGDSERSDVKIDYLVLEGSQRLIPLQADAVKTRNTHGTGCTLSSAIATYLALGYTLEQAVSQAKLYVTRALRSGASVVIGHGHGPVNHFFQPRHLKIHTH
ncbi:MAG: bifunctional hydroxymethylpyrimidine kinase/phosphomethylpyrimidine kinase [Bacteroidales bacterium]|nr:bifunctional hydroxymethylpyrimidine kinase/phosphomethylpyrimidine kinase [Bacteroidales bacterium]